MLVKVGDRVFSSASEIISLKLEPEEKKELKNMPEEHDLFTSCPEGTPKADIAKFNAVFEFRQS